METSWYCQPRTVVYESGSVNMDSYISQRVIEIISQTLNTTVCADDDMNSKIEWDSMAQLSILVNIETAMKCSFEIDDIVRAVSVREWIAITNSTIKSSSSKS